MFYTYTQNNSGGSFHFDELDGITRFVIIEADSAEDANRRAEEIGIYFDGCDNDIDCDCCGDRWYPAWGGSVAVETPTIYGKHFAEGFGNFTWMDKGKEVCVHYADGRKEWA